MATVSVSAACGSDIDQLIILLEHRLEASLVKAQIKTQGYNFVFVFYIFKIFIEGRQ